VDIRMIMNNEFEKEVKKKKKRKKGKALRLTCVEGNGKDL
jgi:hypothetical protein